MGEATTPPHESNTVLPSVSSRERKKEKAGANVEEIFVFVFFRDLMSPNDILTGFTCFIMVIQRNTIANAKLVKSASLL